MVLGSYGILPGGIVWCVEVYGQHTEELRLLIHDILGGVSPFGAAYFLSRTKNLVTLDWTGLELSLSWSHDGKYMLVYTHTICM